MTNKSGRPAKYTYQMLLNELNEFVSKNKMGKITYSSLAKNTNIPRHIWRDNKEIQSDIKRLNQIDIVSVSEESSLPNLYDLVEANYENKDKLKKAIRTYMDYQEKILKKSTKHEENEKKLKSDLERYKNELREAKEQRDFYKEELKRVAVKSTSERNRQELGMKENMISVVNNIDKAGANKSNIVKEFESLFD